MSQQEPNLDKLVSGQKLVIAAILLNLIGSLGYAAVLGSSAATPAAMPMLILIVNVAAMGMAGWASSVSAPDWDCIRWSASF